MTYKYIKGKEVLMDEHMLSASEIAEKYGIYTTDAKTRRPHALLVAALLRNFVIQSNLNVADYFYPHSKGVMKVYPELVWKKAMNDFVYQYDVEIKKTDELIYVKIDNAEEKKNFTFVHYNKSKSSDFSSKVVNINGRRNSNVELE